MKITSDKLDGKPSHSLSPKEVRETIRRLPSEWTSTIKSVHLSASMKSWALASFSRVNKHLVLSTRGRDKEEVARAIARELYANATETHPLAEWRLSAKQKSELDRKVATHLSSEGSTFKTQ